MTEKSSLNILWTNDNMITADKMVFMYAVNAMKFEWWQEITLIIWGAATNLVRESADAQALITRALDAGVIVCACKACADQLGASEVLESLGVDVDYLGTTLTEILKDDEALLTI